MKLTQKAYSYNRFLFPRCKGTCSLHHLSSRSYTSKTTLVDIDSNDQQLIGEGYMKLVHVDFKTKKSTPWPEWFTTKYNNDTKDPFESKDESIQRPDNAFKSSFKIRYSDLDTNLHVTVAEYIRFCTECATDAALAGFYRHFRSDMTLYPMLEIELVYLGEANQNDTVDVFTWQNENGSPSGVFFEVLKGTKCIVKASSFFGLEKLRPNHRMVLAPKL